MNVSCSHFSLPRGLFISVTVHALPFLVVIVLTHFKPAVPEKQVNVLQVELFGMISQQQVAGQEAAAAVEEQETSPKEEAVAPPEPPQPEERKSVLKPVPVRAQNAPHRHQAPAPPRQQASEGQVQQTISQRDLEASLMRQYLASLSRIVRDRLIYPLKARAKGVTGVTFVAFTVSEGGRVVPGSESVRKTSGYDELDQAAVNAVRSAGDLPNPPHQMEVVVAVNFSKSD